MKKYVLFGLLAFALAACGSSTGEKTRNIDPEDPMGEEDMPPKLVDEGKNPTDTLKEKTEKVVGESKQSENPATPIK